MEYAFIFCDGGGHAKHDRSRQALEAGMTSAAPGDRTSERLRSRSAYCSRCLVTGVGELELQVPWDAGWQFSTKPLETCQRFEEPLAATLSDMYVQGVRAHERGHPSPDACGPYR